MNASEWNMHYPIGTMVRYYRDKRNRSGEPIEIKTRSEAWELASGHPVVLIEGVLGGYRLDALEIVEKTLTQGEIK